VVEILKRGSIGNVFENHRSFRIGDTDGAPVGVIECRSRFNSGCRLLSLLRRLSSSYEQHRGNDQKPGTNSTHGELVLPVF
jgi:hypothetical protein